MKRVTHQIIAVLMVLAIVTVGCSPTRHVPAGSYLLDDVKIAVDDSANVKPGELAAYLRQTPNHRILGFMRLQLATYNMSGRDSTKWYNRWLRRMGQAPVIYDSTLTDASRRQLTQALINKGYMNASVDVDTAPRPEKKRMKVTYKVHPRTPHYISSVSYDIPDTAIRRIVMRDTAHSVIRVGSLLDRTALDEARGAITQRLHNNGYYAFTKDNITFIADTAENSHAVDLTLTVQPPRRASGGSPISADSVRHVRYMVNRVYFVTNAIATSNPQTAIPAGSDTVRYGNIYVIYGEDRYIKPSVLDEKCHIRPGQIYRADQVERTYEALAQLGIIKSVNIQIVPVGSTPDGADHLDAYIFLSRNKKQSVTLELEGTNSEGDLGFGLGLEYMHRNLGKRANILTTKFRMNYESLSGDLQGLINDRYTEYAAEAGITFPKFMFPLLSRNFKQRIKASTELALSFNYQQRPEYTRIIAGAAWKYKWANRSGRERRTWDLLDLNYVYLPNSTIDFINQIAPDNPLLRYSYEDHFIMRMGFAYHLTNKRLASTGIQRYTIQPRIFTLRTSVETAGNTLYAISSLSSQRRHDGVYKIFGIQYSQYAKAEIDYSLTRNFNTRHSLAMHVGAGIGVPYGNSHVLPFEKRFYAGGANGVRGWSVRSLGPGSYDSKNSVTDFINQCGDIRLDLSTEYRMKLFWVFEGAIFVDAGNIWTIHNYENQPGGMFKFPTFWRQIALAYGAGLRMDFSYFLLRFDLGMKAHNPAKGQEPWPLIHPRWGRDATFHFAVGYPF